MSAHNDGICTICEAAQLVRIEKWICVDGCGEPDEQSALLASVARAVRKSTLELAAKTIQKTRSNCCVSITGCCGQYYVDAIEGLQAADDTNEMEERLKFKA